MPTSVRLDAESEALLRRLEWLHSVAATVPNPRAPAEFLDQVIGPVAREGTRRMVDLAPSTDAATALVLASAEFQRR